MRTADEQTGSGELSATGRRKRKDIGAKREQVAKGWTEEEESLFLESLELYGREWHKAAAHVGEIQPQEGSGVTSRLPTQLLYDAMSVH